ncbi:MAG: integrase, partial [Deltaproteobacteria bacterium]|nr:integrase [Deltaproteobacteria bacterium]
VVDMLRELKDHTGHTGLLFPSPHDRRRGLSDVALLTALRRMGYGRDEMTVHGFRGVASTLLNEQGFRPDVIEMQLSHVEKNNVRASYNFAEYMQERRGMMQRWADYLDELKKRAGRKA